MSSRPLILILAMGLGACAQHARNAGDEGQFTPAGRPTEPNESITQKQRSLFALSDSRCDREVRCGNVGQGKNMANKDACVAGFNSAGYDALDTQECPDIDQAALSQCLASISLEDCDTKMDSITVLTECRPSALCVR